MKHCHSLSHQGKCKRFHQKYNKGFHKKHRGGDEEKHLLFELFKHFLKTRLEEQQQERQQGNCSGTESQCQETGEVEEIVDSCDEETKKEGQPQRRHCHKFVCFKGGKHQKSWGKHHHGHHQKNHGFHHHGPHHHRHCKQHKC